MTEIVNGSAMTPMMQRIRHAGNGNTAINNVDSL